MSILDAATWLSIGVLVIGASAVFVWFVVDILRPSDENADGNGRGDGGSSRGGAALCLLLAASLTLHACTGERTPSPARTPASRTPASPTAEMGRSSDFGRLHAALSEPEGYFDTDNLISNEASYLHVVGALESLGVRGGAYVGVGPDQNFSYMAVVRPAVAFIIDIRRDNTLEHLLFRALFEAAPTRAEYLGLLVGRSPPDVTEGRWDAADVEELVHWFDEAGPDSAAAERARAIVDSAVVTFGIPLSEADRATVRRFHDEFIGAALDLRFRSFGRAPRAYYPTLRSLLLATNLSGERRSYLARREDYVFLREMERNGRVIPVVGDLAGAHALRRIGEEIRARDETVSALYASNVEFYLFQDRTFRSFADNVLTLPISPNGVLIRSYFPTGGGRHPHAVPGFYSTQTLTTLRSFTDAVSGGGYRSYFDLVTRDAIDPRESAVPR